MNALGHDARVGWRLMLRQRTTSLVAVSSLVVGMSLVSVVFALLNAALLRPLPVLAPDELVMVVERRDVGINHNLSYPDFADYRAGRQAFVDLLASSPIEANVNLGTQSAIVRGELVSGSYFSTLGVGLRSGRALTDADEQLSGPPVVVLSERLWKAWGRSIPLSPNETLRINDTTFTVVGLVGGTFGGIQTGRRAELWVPISQQPTFFRLSSGHAMATRQVSWLTLMGRRRPGVTDEAAAADLNRLESGLWGAAGRPAPMRLFVTPGSQGASMLSGAAIPTLRILLAAGIAVLLVACGNVANLLMARTADRGRELMVRCALGASRARIARLLLLEAFWIAAVSTVLSLLVSQAGAEAAMRFMVQYGEPIALDLSLDWRVMAFVLGLGLTVTLASALAPALYVLRFTGVSALSDGSRSATTGRLSRRVRVGLLVGQFAVSLALVGSALLLTKSVVNLSNVATGVATDEVALLAVAPASAQYEPERVYAYLVETLRRIQQQPGVKSAGFADVPPVSPSGSRMSIMVPGFAARDAEAMEVNFNTVLGDYFEALGLAVLHGEVFTYAVTAGAPIPAVINTTMAGRFWPAARPIGQRFHLGTGVTDQVAIVVGVVADTKYRGLREEPLPSFYVPITPRQAGNGTFHIRVFGDPSRALPVLRRAVAESDSAVPVVSALTLRAQQSASVSDDRLAMTIGIVLAAATTLLAGVGLFGAMSHMVGQRIREIGIRVALGATPPSVSRLILGNALAIALAGSVIGMAVAAWVTSYMANRLFGVERFDVASFVSAALVLGAVAVVSGVAPAHRASRIDPVCALRHD